MSTCEMCWCAMPRALITATGGDVGQSVSYLMHRHFAEFTLVGCDMNDSDAARAAVDFFSVAPRADSDEYLPWLRLLIEAQGIDIIIPTSDAELSALARVSDLPMIMAGPMAIEIGSDKWRTAEYLASLGIPGPWTDTTYPPRALPCVIKPRSGQGSKNVAICRTAEQAATAWSDAGELALAQELLAPSDQEITCAVYRSATGEIRVIQLLRRLEGGMTSWAQVIEEPRILAQCETLARRLEVTGSINVQLILTDEGPRIFEINPRFSSTVAMRDALGFSDLKWAVDEFLGRALPEFSVCAVGSTVTREAVPRVEPPSLEER